MYRSFITCDDPKGVVECSTIRKSKSGSQKMESTVVSRRSRKNSSASSTYKEESHMVSKGVTKEIQNPSSFQLMEVSKGAQNLNRVIDSWSDGMTFDGHSEDVAKDLLKGALDLQDSLVMLSKLQEASHYMAQLKKKQEKSGKGRIGEMGSERTNYNQFGDTKCQMGFQMPKLSTDSRDCFEELRQVIKDGLARQNLLPNSCTEEEASFSRNTSVSARDTPSTSSGQSSTVHSHESTSFDCPLPSKTPQKKRNGPNLIAKLMGLEEIPSKQLQSIPQKQSERRPIFDLDMPKTMNPPLVVQKGDPARRSLKEILETVQFEGLLRSSSLKEFKPSSRHPNSLPSKKRSIDDAPPIVIMRPMCSCLAAEEPCNQMYFQQDGAPDTKEMFRKLIIKKVVPTETTDCRKRVLKSHGKCKNLEAEETPIERLSQDEEVKDCKEVLAKPEEKEVKAKEKLSSNKLKAYVPVNHKAHKESIDKQVNKIQKVTHTRRKPVEVENLKSKGVSRSHDHAKMGSRKLQNPEKGSNIPKNRIAQKKGTAPNLDSKHTLPTISHRSIDWKKNPRNMKPVREPISTNFAAETIGCWDDTKGINSMPEDESDLIRTDTVPAEGMDASVIQVKDHCNNSQHALCEVRLQTIQHETGTEFAEEDQCINSQNALCVVRLQTIQHESSIESAEEANYCMSHNSTEKNKFFRTETDLRDLLLRSPLFLSHAEELFCISAHQPIQTARVNDFRIADPKILLDCANEFMELKSLQCPQTAHPLLQIPMQSSRTCISLDQLVGEVCDGIENLRCYQKLADENLPIDSICAVMDRDLRCKGAAGAWDWGWRNGFTVDEVEQVMDDIEKFVLSRLIEELLTDVVL